jgi:hypothetical protein
MNNNSRHNDEQFIATNVMSQALSMRDNEAKTAIAIENTSKMARVWIAFTTASIATTLAVVPRANRAF